MAPETLLSICCEIVPFRTGWLYVRLLALGDEFCYRLCAMWNSYGGDFSDVRKLCKALEISYGQVGCCTMFRNKI